jgi:hypothetical protein
MGKPAISRLLLKHKTQTPQIAQLFAMIRLFSQATEKIIKLDLMASILIWAARIIASSNVAAALD